MDCPRIVVHESSDAPPAHRFLGSFFTATQRLPILFNGTTRDGVIDAMRKFWADEQAKNAEIAANRAARSAKMRGGK